MIEFKYGICVTEPGFKVTKSTESSPVASLYQSCSAMLLWRLWGAVEFATKPLETQYRIFAATHPALAMLEVGRAASEEEAIATAHALEEFVRLALTLTNFPQKEQE